MKTKNKSAKNITTFDELLDSGFVIADLATFTPLDKTAAKQSEIYIPKSEIIIIAT
jgi:hypothetical protein